MKLSKEEFDELQEAKDLLVERGVMNTSIAHRIQNILDNRKNGKGSGQWGTRFKEEHRRDLRVIK